ncbi:MAG: hypothetical protein WBW98_16690, partial [Candidatus Sulfotelmatobacter sp.]
MCNLFARVLPLPRQEEAMKIAGIDVHKKVLMVVVVDASTPEEKPERRRFATLPSELHLKDAERLVRRLIANELILSFVPDGEQRIWRSMARMKLQLTRDRVRLQNQMECLLEEMRIRLSIVVSHLLGAGGLRILRALAQGETDPKQLAQLGDERLQCTEEQLVDALTGRAQPMHRAMLGLQLERLQ